MMVKAFGIVYVHINKLNGKAYVGQTCQTTKRRWRKDSNGINYNSYKNCTVFFRALERYTWSNFETIELCSAKNQEDLDFMEEYFINLYSTVVPNGYNTLDFANGKVVFTEEVKAKIAAAHIGRKTGEPSWNRKYHIEIGGIMHKGCSKCKETKPLDNFCKDKSAKWDGYSYYCKQCRAKAMVQYRKREELLTPEELVKSYEERSIKMGASIQARFDSDPEYKKKISISRSKAIVAINPNTGETLEFESALKAKEAGYHNVTVSRAIKDNRIYKGFKWSFKK